jgi:hypothetical protein
MSTRTESIAIRSIDSPSFAKAAIQYTVHDSIGSKKARRGATMREHGRGQGLFGPPRGEPARPFVEAILLFSAFYLPAYLPLGPALAEISIAKPVFHVGLAVANSTRALLLLYLMAIGEGLAAFGLGAFRKRDLLRGLFTALGAFVAIIPSTLLFSTLGVTNPLLAGVGTTPRAPFTLVPFFLVSSLSTGYAEELFFRSYLARRLERSGLSPLWTVIVSSLLFGAAHGAQGIGGMVSTTLVGLWLAWRWHNGRNIHEVAIGHAFYDAAIFAVALYS